MRRPETHEENVILGILLQREPRRWRVSLTKTATLTSSAPTD